MKLFIEDASSSNLIAWCSFVNNKIRVDDLETKQEYVQFDGARLNVGNRIYIEFLSND